MSKSKCHYYFFKISFFLANLFYLLKTKKCYNIGSIWGLLSPIECRELADPCAFSSGYGVLAVKMIIMTSWKVKENQSIYNENYFNFLVLNVMFEKTSIYRISGI